MALHKRARMTWSEIILADKHGLGLETMPKDSIKPTVPEQFKDTDKFIVLRYEDNRRRDSSICSRRDSTHSRIDRVSSAMRRTC